MDRMKSLSEAIKKLVEEEFNGYLKINFTQGSLGRIEKSEEIEDSTIILKGRNLVRTRSEGENVGHQALKSLPVMLLLSVAISGCAVSGMARPAEPIADDAGIRMSVKPGDVADVRYLCRLKSGEVAAATDPVATSQPKSKIYAERTESVPVSITAISAEQAMRPVLTPMGQRSFEEEIQNQLGPAIIGMKEGEKRTAELKAEDAAPAVSERYLARLNRVRVQPKVVVMKTHTYEYLMDQSPEIGQAYTYDTDFPGTVESLSDTEVTIRISAIPGTVKETPFGPGHIREDADNYLLEIDARKGALVRAANMVGRITSVDDNRITADFGNAFGGETLLCEVTVDKIANADIRTSETSTR